MFPMHGGFMGKKKGGGSCPSYVPGKYTAEQIDNLVFVEGYIPVGSETEFRSIPFSVNATMGAGTCWEGTYTCGNDKKYVQVTPITINDNVIGTSLSGIYDGNWQLITFIGLRSLFALSETTGQRILRNLYIDATFGPNNVQGFSVLGNTTQAYTIEDCGLLGAVTQTGTNGRMASLLGVVNNSGAIIRRCWSKAIVTTGSSNQNSGGLVGWLTSGIVENCWNSGLVDGLSSCGGFIGRVGAGGIVRNSYTIAPVNGTLAGGLIANNAGTVQNSYWNTDTGPATSAGGTASNTLALQTPTSPTGIFATWDAAVWDFGTSSDYPTLIGPPPATP